jgi:hypothetical protein
MTLKDYVRGMSAKHKGDLCRECGITRAYLYMLAKGDRKPGVELARQLVDSSRGILTLPELRPDIWGGKAA